MIREEILRRVGVAEHMAALQGYPDFLNLTLESLYNTNKPTPHKGVMKSMHMLSRKEVASYLNDAHMIAQLPDFHVRNIMRVAKALYYDVHLSRP